MCISVRFIYENLYAWNLCVRLHVCIYLYICMYAYSFCIVYMLMYVRFCIPIRKKTLKNINKNIKGNDTDMTYRYDTNMTRRYDTQIQRTRFRMHAEYRTHPRPSISCLASAADNVSHVPGSKSAVVWKRT